MGTYAIVNQSTGHVENLIIWDGETTWSRPPGSVLVGVDGVSPPPGIDWTNSPVGSSTFTAPSIASTVPQSISRYQALAALSNAGLLSQVQTAVQNAGALALLAFQSADPWTRNGPFVSQFGQALNMTAAQIDQLFIEAAAIIA
jgi:hypothetical protein